MSSALGFINSNASSYLYLWTDSKPRNPGENKALPSLVNHQLLGGTVDWLIIFHYVNKIDQLKKMLNKWPLRMIQELAKELQKILILWGVLHPAMFNHDLLNWLLTAPRNTRPAVWQHPQWAESSYINH